MVAVICKGCKGPDAIIIRGEPWHGICYRLSFSTPKSSPVVYFDEPGEWGGHVEDPEHPGLSYCGLAKHEIKARASCVRCNSADKDK